MQRKAFVFELESKSLKFQRRNLVGPTHTVTLRHQAFIVPTAAFSHLNKSTEQSQAIQAKTSVDTAAGMHKSPLFTIFIRTMLGHNQLAGKQTIE